MALDAWLPIGHKLPGDARAHVPIFEGKNWQVVETGSSGRALLANDELAQHWLSAGLIEPGLFSPFTFGDRRLWVISSGSGQIICPVTEGDSPNTKAEALSFALALKATREIDPASPLQDAIYVEKISRLLPTYSISPRVDDDVVLGYWLTGGASISAKSFRRLRQTMSWLGADHLKAVVQAAGFVVSEVVTDIKSRPLPSRADVVPVEHGVKSEKQIEQVPALTCFELAGRPDLAAFFNEHVVDIVKNPARYKAMGIDFPSAVVLHGPPGCGKTFAVERLIDFLGWPSFQIDASSVASPYIHETSKKVAEIFDKAMENAPSVLVIDEMEAFLADRDMGSGHHRVEEVAEFLRRIPEAAKNRVLIIAMTNRVDMIDPAILRRGRFDHVIEVNFASEVEIAALLETLLLALPKEVGIDPKPFARELAGRPLSDVAFVVREGARLAARSGKEKLDQVSLWSAMHAAPARDREGSTKRRIGF